MCMGLTAADTPRYTSNVQMPIGFIAFYQRQRRVGTLVSLDHEALREIFEMANH